MDDRTIATATAASHLSAAAIAQDVYGPGSPEHQAAHQGAITALETAFDAGATVADVHATAEHLPGYKH